MNPVATSDAAFRGGACPTPEYTIAYTGNYTTSADANFDVSEQGLPRFCLRRPSALMDKFDLEGVEEAFHWGIIVTIARAAHRGRRTDRGQVVDIGARCVLRSAIRVTDETAVGSLPLGSHHHGRQSNSVACDAHCPSNDLAGCKVEHRGQIQPPFTGRDIGNVGEPDRFGAVATKFWASRFGAIGNSDGCRWCTAETGAPPVRIR